MAGGGFCVERLPQQLGINPRAGLHSKKGEGIFRLDVHGCVPRWLSAAGVAVLQDCCMAEGMKGFFLKTLLWFGVVALFTLVAVARLNYFDRDLWPGISATVADLTSWVMVKYFPRG